MQHEPITASPSAQQHSSVEQPAAGGCSNGQYAAQHGAPSPRQYVWLGNRPTCSQCGDRGHEAGSCSTPFCNTCGKYGHLPGACNTACSMCGKPHTNHRGCIVCKQCGLFGHLHTMCTETQCGQCFNWGHSTRDCIVEDGGPTTSPGPSSPLQPAAVKASTAMQPAAAGHQHAAPARGRPEQQLQHTAAPYIPRHSPARAAGSPAVGAEEAAMYSSSYEEHQHWPPQPQQHYQQQYPYQQPYSYQEGYPQPYPHGPPGLSYGQNHPQHWQHSGPPETQHQAASSSSYSPGQVPERMQVLSVAQRHLLSYGKLNRTGSNHSSSDGQAHTPPPPPPPPRPPPPGFAPSAGDPGQWQPPQPMARQDSSSSTTSMLAALQPEQHVDRQQQQPPEQELEQQWPQQEEEQQQQEGQQQPQQQEERSSRQYVWPAQIPTCFICGDRGHAADCCTTPSCAVCGRLGHDTGMCERHCSTCGKQHKGRGCKQCKLCGLFGHLSTVCFDRRCDLCGCWGHTKQDCPSVCKCGYHEPHSPAECPGLCTKCLEYGHFTRDCTATQCPICQQWGKGCTDTQCATTGTRTAAAAVPQPPPPPQQQQRRPAASTSASSMGRSSSSPQAGRIDAASGSPAAAADRGPSRFASDVLRPGSSAEQRSSSSSSSSTAPPQKQQPAAARRPGSSSVSVQLEVLSEAEDVQRRQAFINLLLAQERPELVAYGTQLLDEPGKLTVLVRVPKAVMKGQVLAGADAVQQMEDIYAAHSGSSWRSADGARGPAGQQLLPEHADAFEAAFPPGFLPSNWRSLTFRAIEDQIPGAKWAMLSRYMIEAKEVFRQAKRDAKAKTAAAATGQTGAQQPSQQQASQQQQQDRQAQSEAQQRPGQQQQQQQQVPSYSADRASRLAESARTASPGTQASSNSQPAAQPRKGTTTSPTVPGSSSSAARQQEMPPAGEQAAPLDAAAFRAEAVQLEAVPPPSVAAERKSQLADILLTHPNGDLRDYGLLLVGDDLRLDVLIRVPWAALQACFSEQRAVQLLDELIAHHTQQHSPPQQQRQAQGPAQQTRPPAPPAAVRQEQQQQQPQQEPSQLPAVPQYVEEDNEEHEEDSDEGSQQQQQQQGATGMAAAQRSGQQQQGAGTGSGYEHIKPKDLLPEYAAELEERFKLLPGWRSAASWREVESRYARSISSKRSAYRTRRRELQALTAEHLAAAGGQHSAAAVGSSTGASDMQGGSNGTGQLAAEQREQEPAAAGAVSSSQACAGDYDKQMLPQPALRAVGSKDDEAREVAFTTKQLFAHLPEYTEQLLGSGEAGPKMSFFSRIDKADLDRVLGQRQVPPGQLLDALYEQHMAAQSSGGGGGQSGVQAGGGQGRAVGPAVARLSKGSTRGCAQS